MEKKAALSSTVSGLLVLCFSMRRSLRSTRWYTRSLTLRSGSIGKLLGFQLLPRSSPSGRQPTSVSTVKLLASPQVALPELHLQSRSWNSHCIAVRKFSGVARDRNIMKEVEQLALSLCRSPWANATSKSKFAYSIGQDDSPLRLIGRVNEIWVIVDASGSEDCASPGVTTYRRTTDG